MTDLRVALGVRIEELRIAARLTRAQLAESLEVDIRQVASYELEGAWPGPETSLSLAAALGIEIHELYNFTPSRVVPKLPIADVLSFRENRRLRRSSRQG